MNPAEEAPTGDRCRRDGWTLRRRRQFLGLLSSGSDVRRACRAVGLSRQAAYELRRRDEGFAQAWDDALRAARAAADQAFLAMLPENLLRTMSTMSGTCELPGAGLSAQDNVRVVRGV